MTDTADVLRRCSEYLAAAAENARRQSLPIVPKALDDLAAEARAEAGRFAWMQCSKRMPEPNTAVLACLDMEGDGPDVVIAAFIHRGVWRRQDSWNGTGSDGDVELTVTHWRPLPTPPKEPNAH